MANELKAYESVGVAYEAANSYYEAVLNDCFDGLEKLFNSMYPHGNDDLRELLFVVGWELCKARAEIARMKFIMDFDRIPEGFIEPLANMFGVTSFPVNSYPEEKRKYLAFVTDAMRFKGSMYGLELVLKSLMPFDKYTIEPMYKRSLRTYHKNNDFTGGKLLSVGDVEIKEKRTYGYEVDYFTFGPKTYPTGIRIYVEKQGSRNNRTINGLVGRIKPVVDTFMPENSFYEFKLVSPPVLLDATEENKLIILGII